MGGCLPLVESRFLKLRLFLKSSHTIQLQEAHWCFVFHAKTRGISAGKHQENRNPVHRDGARVAAT